MACPAFFLAVAAAATASAAKTFGAPLESLDNLQHTTNITLGTPPQPLRALVDVSFAGLFTHAVSGPCGPPGSIIDPCRFRKLQYSAAASDTAESTGERFNVTFAPGTHKTEVGVGSDAFSVAGGAVSAQAFIEGLGFRQSGPLHRYMQVDGWDAILGLGPDDSSSAGDNPLVKMVAEDAIEHAVVSMQLGRRTLAGVDVPGEVTFGGVDEALLKPGSRIRYLPTVDKRDATFRSPLIKDSASHPVFNTTWQVAAQSVSFGWPAGAVTDDDHPQLHVELSTDDGKTNGPSGGVARFESTVPRLALPPAVVQALAALVPPTRRRDSLWGWTIDCDAISRLPALVFVLGDGDEFVLSPDDYIIEVTTDYRRSAENRILFDQVPARVCPWNIVPSHSDDFVVLGSAFMRAFYMVFDWERQMIGFGEPAWKQAGDGEALGEL